MKALLVVYFDVCCDREKPEGGEEIREKSRGEFSRAPGVSPDDVRVAAR